ncbi:MAG: hypothetical protein RJB01_936 [Actinomycetota bacterium]
MLSTALAFVGSPAAMASTLNAQPRIVGGVPIPITESPWQVAVVGNGSTLCGGSLIASNWVLTAAHCIGSATSISVYAGITELNSGTGENRFGVVQAITNPGYSSTSFANDLTLIQLDRPITPGPTMAPIALPTGEDPASWPTVGSAATISGWGAERFGGSSLNSLRQGVVQVLTNPGSGDCGQYGSSFNGTISICAGLPQGGVDSCQGDSGGPLVVAGAAGPTLAGVTSVGNDCGQSAYPGIYTRVSAFLDWIRSYVPLPAAAPNPPAKVTVTALAAGTARITWEAGAANGSPITEFTASAQPGGVSCVTGGTACDIGQLPPGEVIAVTVTATNAAGTSAASAPAQALMVDGTSAPGARIAAARIARWADIPRKPGDRITMSVPKSYRAVCRVSGTRVVMRAPGTCVARVVVKRTTGKTMRGSAFINVLVPDVAPQQ